MKFLHTSDWHVGKTLKGRNRLDEQKAVLAEIVGLARRPRGRRRPHRRRPLRDRPRRPPTRSGSSSGPLMTLASDGIEVIAIAGNHDHGGTFEAYRPLMGRAGIHLFGQARPADKGGVYTLHRAQSTGEPVNVAVLPVPVPAVRGAGRGDHRAETRPGAERRLRTTSWSATSSPTSAAASTPTRSTSSWRT